MHTKAYRGRHRLGTPGLVHCALYPEIAATLDANHRSRPAALLLTARSSIARFGRTLRRVSGASVRVSSV